MHTDIIISLRLPQFQRPFSSWTSVGPYQNVSILDFIVAKDDGRGGNNRSYKSCKTPVKMSPPTNQHPFFTGRMPCLSPNQQCQITERIIMLPPLIGGGIKRCFCLTSVRLSDVCRLHQA